MGRAPCYLSRRVKTPAQWPAFLGVFAAAFDNLAMTPLLKAIAQDFKVPLAETTGVASAYFLSYGLFQLPWGLASERLGRVRVMRLGLVCGVLANGLSLLAPSLDVLVVARFVSGAGLAAVVPSVIAWLGDVLPEAARPKAAGEMNSAYAVGSAAGVLGAGVLADAFGWHAGFGASATLCLVGLLASLRLPSTTPSTRAGTLRDAWSAAPVRWLAGIAFVEGAVLFGLFAYVAPTMLASGETASFTGLVVAVYGVAVVVIARSMPLVARGWSVLRTMSVGGAALVLAWAAVSVWPSAFGVFAAAVLLAVTIVLFHSNLQVWATQAAPTARGPAVALFAGSLFVGASVGSRLARPVFAAGQVRALYAAGAVVAAVVVLVALMARRKSLSAPVSAK